MAHSTDETKKKVKKKSVTKRVFASDGTRGSAQMTTHFDEEGNPVKWVVKTEK